MRSSILDLTEHLVPISEFSQGKAGRIFSDVAEHNTEYIVLKNNQPTAVLISVKEYKETQKKVEQLENLLERLENYRLLLLAEKRKKSKSDSFEDFIKKEGYSMDELKMLAESVEIE